MTLARIYNFWFWILDRWCPSQSCINTRSVGRSSVCLPVSRLVSLKSVLLGAFQNTLSNYIGYFKRDQKQQSNLIILYPPKGCEGPLCGLFGASEILSFKTESVQSSMLCHCFIFFMHCFTMIVFCSCYIYIFAWESEEFNYLFIWTNK